MGTRFISRAAMSGGVAEFAIFNALWLRAAKVREQCDAGMALPIPFTEALRR